jgi:hypothetical protein
VDRDDHLRPPDLNEPDMATSRPIKPLTWTESLSRGGGGIWGNDPSVFSSDSTGRLGSRVTEFGARNGTQGALDDDPLEPHDGRRRRERDGDRRPPTCRRPPDGMQTGPGRIVLTKDLL